MITGLYDSLVLVSIKRLQDEGKACSYAALQEETGLSDKGLTPAINRLEEQNRISVERQKGRLNVYVILDQPGPADYTAAAALLSLIRNNK